MEHRQSTTKMGPILLLALLTLSAFAGVIMLVPTAHALGPSLTLSYVVSGGPDPSSPPTLTYTSVGVVTYLTLTNGPQTVTPDVGTSWNVSPNPIPDVSPDQWLTPQATAGMFTTTYSAVLTYYFQYDIEASYGVAGGGGFSAPILTYRSTGTTQHTTLTATPTNYWVDAFTAWSAPNSLSGSPSSNERAWTSQTTYGVLDGPITAEFDYYVQFGIFMSYAVLPTGTTYTGNPTLAYVSGGAAQTGTLLEYQSVQFWMDAGTSWSVTNPFTSGIHVFVPSQISGTVYSGSLVNTAPIKIYYSTAQTCTSSDPLTLLEGGCVVPAFFDVYMNIMGLWFPVILMGIIGFGLYMKTENGLLVMFLEMIAAIIFGALFPPEVITFIGLAFAIGLTALVYAIIRSRNG